MPPARPLLQALPQHFLGALDLEYSQRARWWSAKQCCGCIPGSHRGAAERTLTRQDG
jgi:hypothetical protein